MRTYLLAGAAALLLTTSPAVAQSAFNGVWALDLASAQLTDKPFTTTVKNGTFTCDSCVPSYSVPSDGAFHHVAGQSAVDEVSVTLVNPRTMKMVERKGGKVMRVETDTVGANPQMLTYEAVNSSATSGKTSTEVGSQTRVGAIDPKAHLTSGAWRTVKISDAGHTTTTTFDVIGRTVHRTSSTGQSYIAQLGGPYVQITGSVIPVEVAVTQPKPGVLVETYRRDGKVGVVRTMNLSGNGRTMQIAVANKLMGTVDHLIAHKQ